MAIPALTDAQIDQDSPLDQNVMKAGLRDRDNYNWSTATGAGIGPNVQAFVAGFVAHKHDGTAGNGDPIPAAGIASNAVNDSAMIAPDAVTGAKVATKTMDANHFQTGSVTSAKMHNTMGTHFTGTVAYNTGSAPGAGDRLWLGDTTTVSHGKGTTGVVCNMKAGANSRIDCFILSITNSQVKLGMDLGSLPASGNWYYDFYFM